MKKLLLLILFTVMIAPLVNALPPSIPGFKTQYSDSTRYFVKGSDSTWVTDGGLSYKKFYNVKHYGAVGDSSADDKAAILSAIDAYRSDGDGNGAIIYFPPGVYRLSDSITIPIDTLEGISIIGAGLSTRIYLEGTGGFYIYDTTATGKTGIEISGLRIENLASNTTAQFGIYIYKTGLLKIQDVSIYGGGYLDKAIFIHGSQQGYIKGGYLYQCVEGLVFDNSTSGDIHSNGVHVSGVTITCTSTANEYTRGVRYSGSNTGVFIGNHITNCSTLVKVDTGQQALQLLGNHLETGDIGFEIDGSSNINLSGNAVYDCNKSLYLKRGNTHHVSNNLFNDSVVVGAGSATNDFAFNLFSAPFVDSIEIGGDSSNYNTFIGNKNQGTGNAPSGLRYTTKTTDSLDLYIYTTAGAFNGRVVGTDSAYLEIKGIGADVPYGFRFSKYGEISYNTSTQNGMRFYTNNSSNDLTQRFQFSGAVDSIRAAFSNTSKLILPPIAWIGNATDSAIITEPFIDSIRANQFGGSGVWTISATKDTLCMNDTTGTASLCWYWDGSNWISGGEGTTIIDTLLITAKFCIIVNGGTDTVCIDTSGFADNDILKYDAATKTLQAVAESGGSGSVDSMGVLETTTGTDSLLWNVDQPINLRTGNGLLTGHGDSANIDTVQFSADTTVLATLNALNDSTGTKLKLSGGTMTGNIAMSGAETVDGIDISTIPSTYEVQLNNEAGLYAVLSDVADFLQLSDTASTVADGSAQIVTGNAIYDFIIAQAYLTANQTITLSGDVTGSGTTAITTTIGASRVDSSMLNATEVDEYIADKTGAMVSGNTESGIAVTYDDADNTLDFMVQNVVSSMIAQQTILPADIDSTAQNFVFDDAYRGTSATTDSLLTTKRYVDSLAEAADNDTITITNLQVYGNADIFGQINQSNVKDTIPMSYIRAKNTSVNDTGYIKMPIPEQYWSGDLKNKYAQGHPTVRYLKQGFGEKGFNYAATVTPLAFNVPEDANFLVSYDGKVWGQYYVGADSVAATDSTFAIGYSDSTLHNPVWSEDSTVFGTPDFLSDVDNEIANGRFYMFIRAIYSAADSATYWVTSAPLNDLLTWTTPVHIITLDNYNNSLLSATFKLDTNNTWKMWCVQRDTLPASDTTMVVMWESPTVDSFYADGGWTIVDTTNADDYSPTTYGLWHPFVFDWSTDVQMMISSRVANGGSGLGGGLNFLVSYDRGLTWTNLGRVLINSGGSSFESTSLYRSSAFRKETPDGTLLDLFYGAYGAPDDTSGVWRVGHTTVTFIDTNFVDDKTLFWSDTSGTFGITTKRFVRDSTIEKEDTTSLIPTKGFLSQVFTDSNFIRPTETKNRSIYFECSDVVGRMNVGDDTSDDSLVLTQRITLSDGIPVLAIDSSYQVTAGSTNDTLRFVWDVLPKDIVSVDSVVFVWKETGTSSIEDMFVLMENDEPVADSVASSDLTTSRTAATWTKVSISIGNSDVSEGEHYAIRMRCIVDESAAIYIARMYLVCTVQYTY